MSIAHEPASDGTYSPEHLAVDWSRSRNDGCCPGRLVNLLIEAAAMYQKPPFLIHSSARGRRTARRADRTSGGGANGRGPQPRVLDDVPISIDLGGLSWKDGNAGGQDGRGTKRIAVRANYRPAGQPGHRRELAF